jgi:hypothetical protein
MHFPTSLLLALSTLSTLFTLTSAADCWDETGSQICLDSKGAWDLRQQYCGSTSDWNTVTQRVGFSSINTGYMGQVTRIGVFENQQECWNILADIISTCLGESDGGSWTISGFAIYINFCLNIAFLESN